MESALAVEGIDMIIFYCKHCEKELKTVLANAGKVAICPRCRGRSQVPEVPILLDDDVELIVTPAPAPTRRAG